MIGFKSRCVWWNWTHRIISSNFTILLSTICISPNINNSRCKLIPVLVTLLRFCNPSTLIYNNRVLSKARLSHTIFFHRLVLVLFSGKSDLRERRWIFLLLCITQFWLNLEINAFNFSTTFFLGMFNQLFYFCKDNLELGKIHLNEELFNWHKT